MPVHTSAFTSSRSRRRSHQPPTPERRPEPVRSEAEALRIFQLAAAHPIDDETLAFLLDHEGIGGVITVVAGTTDPDAVLPVVECIGRAAAFNPRATALVVASMRPGCGALPDDTARWFAASDLAADHGVHLLDWFVIGPDGATSMRRRAGEADRWHLVTPPPGLDHLSAVATDE